MIRIEGIPVVAARLAATTRCAKTVQTYGPFSPRLKRLFARLSGTVFAHPPKPNERVCG